MKIKHIFFLALTTVFCQNLKSQNFLFNGYINYELKEYSQEPEIIEFWFNQQEYAYTKKIKDFRKTTNYKVFLNNVKNKKDSIALENIIDSINRKNNELPEKFTAGSLKSNIIIQNEYDENQKLVCVSDELNLINWELKNETRLINGYTCQKAEGKFGNMVYEAWFTSKIPVSVAPFQLRGLPGLIIELINKNTGTIIRAIRVEWQTVSKSIRYCDSKNIISRKEYIEKNINKKQTINDKIKGAKNISEILQNLNQ
jgi:GLPGLI family protein